MDPLLITFIVAITACVAGFAVGWRLALRHYQQLMNNLEQESGARSLELLETRQHLRKISAHLKTTLKKDSTIRRLRRRQKSLQQEIDQQVLRARRQEKAHFIQTAKIKLELIEARMQSSKAAESSANTAAAAVTHNGAGNGHIDDNYLTEKNGSSDFGRLNRELQSLLEDAGIKRVRQVARLSKQEIDKLASQQNNLTAE